MPKSSIDRQTSIFHTEDGCAHITVRPLEKVDDGVIIELEVSLNPDTRKGTIPDKWSVTWINYAEVIQENFAPFVEKYCPEPKKVLSLFEQFCTERLSYP